MRSVVGIASPANVNKVIICSNDISHNNVCSSYTTYWEVTEGFSQASQYTPTVKRSQAGHKSSNLKRFLAGKKGRTVMRFRAVQQCSTVMRFQVSQKRSIVEQP